jgi:hypothetical protein
LTLTSRIGNRAIREFFTATDDAKYHNLGKVLCPAMPHESGVAFMIGGLSFSNFRCAASINDRSADPAVLHALASHGYT